MSGTSIIFKLRIYFYSEKYLTLIPVRGQFNSLPGCKWQNIELLLLCKFAKFCNHELPQILFIVCNHKFHQILFKEQLIHCALL